MPKPSLLQLILHPVEGDVSCCWSTNKTQKLIHYCNGVTFVMGYSLQRCTYTTELYQKCLLYHFGWDGDLLFILVQILDCDPRQHKYEWCTWEGVRHGETTRCWDKRDSQHSSCPLSRSNEKTDMHSVCLHDVTQKRNLSCRPNSNF